MGYITGVINNPNLQKLLVGTPPWRMISRQAANLNDIYTPGLHLALIDRAGTLMFFWCRHVILKNPNHIGDPFWAIPLCSKRHISATIRISWLTSKIYVSYNVSHVCFIWIPSDMCQRDVNYSDHLSFTLSSEQNPGWFVSYIRDYTNTTQFYWHGDYKDSQDKDPYQLCLMECHCWVLASHCSHCLFLCGTSETKTPLHRHRKDHVSKSSRWTSLQFYPLHFISPKLFKKEMAVKIHPVQPAGFVWILLKKMSIYSDFF